MARAKWWPATIHTRGNVRKQITFVTLKISSTGLQFVPVCQHHPKHLRMPTSNRNSHSPSPDRLDQNARGEQCGPALANAEGFDQLAVISSDLLGNITGWSQAALELYGLAHDEPMGRRLASIFSSDAIQQEKLQKAILTAAIEKGSYRGKIAAEIRSRKSGQNASIEISVTLLRGASSAPVGLIILSAAPRVESHLATMTLQTQEASSVPPPLIFREIDGTQSVLARRILLTAVRPPH